jgi:hypothetical protein
VPARAAMVTGRSVKEMNLSDGVNLDDNDHPPHHHRPNVPNNLPDTLKAVPARAAMVTGRSVTWARPLNVVCRDDDDDDDGDDEDDNDVHHHSRLKSAERTGHFEGGASACGDGDGQVGDVGQTLERGLPRQRGNHGAGEEARHLGGKVGVSVCMVEVVVMMMMMMMMTPGTNTLTLHHIHPHEQPLSVHGYCIPHQVIQCNDITDDARHATGTVTDPYAALEERVLAAAEGI